MPDSELETPILLTALPQVLDPFFHRSVVLLLHHTEEGSFGFIVNRPTEIRIAEILKGMEISWAGDPGTLAYFGGPVQPQLGTVLFRPPPHQGDPEEGTVSEIVPGLSITQHVGDLATLAGDPPASFRLYLGYSGWAAGQLVEEILRNDWLTAPVDPELLFSSQPERIWEAAVQSAGVDPAALPSWTPQGGGDGAN